MASDKYTTIERVETKSGLLSIFESKEKSVARATKELNKKGYKVIAVYPDGDFSAIERLKVNALTVVSLGIYGRKPGMILVAEKIR